MRRFGRVGTTLVLLVGLTLAVSSSPILADQAAARTIGPFEGTVVDAEGKPVAGATVWLIGGAQDDPQIVAETTSDEKGRFQIAKQPWKPPAPSERTVPTMLAGRDSTGRIGGSVYYGHSQLPNDISPKEFRIKLQNVKDCHGRLVDLSGQPIAAAKIRPAVWVCEWNREERVQHLIFFPTRLVKEWTTETAADGRFTLRNLPTIGRISAKIVAGGFGEPTGSWKLGGSAELQLGRVGVIHGSVTCPQDANAVAKIKLKVATDVQSRRAAEADCVIYYSAEGTTTAEGAFEFKNVPPGKYAVRPDLPASSHYYSEGGGPIEVKSGETARTSLTLKRAAKLQGKVVDQQSGKGVAGVRVALFNNRPFETGQNLATTDAKGEVGKTAITRLRALPNADQAYLICPTRGDTGLVLVGNTPQGLLFAARTLVR